MTKLIFTCASIKELPYDWLLTKGYPIITVKGIKTGSQTPKKSSIFFLITGCGYKNAIEAAKLIAKTFSPISVVNLGTCGITGSQKKFELANIFFIKETNIEQGDSTKCPYTHLPFPIPYNLELNFEGLTSVKEPLLEDKNYPFPLVDMEAGFQHNIFKEKGIPFFSLKISTDYCNAKTPAQYKNMLPHVRQTFKDVLSFLDCKSFDPKISVIIPVKDRPLKVKRAIASVLNQTYKPEEIIVVDDASKIPLKDQLDEDFLKKIRILRLKKNMGVSFCRNLGIKKAKGDWIALLDSDDEWKKNKLKNQINYIRKNPLFEILQCDEIWIRNNVRVNRCKHHQKQEGYIFKKSLELCAISPSAVLFSKELLKSFGLFDIRFPVCEDYELWLRITRQKPVGFNQQKDLIKYGGHNDQLSRSYEAMDRFRVVALLKALEQEKEPYFKNLLIDSLKKRLTILYNGALKRSKRKIAHIYKELFIAIEQSQDISWQNYQTLLKKYL